MRRSILLAYRDALEALPHLSDAAVRYVVDRWGMAEFVGRSPASGTMTSLVTGSRGNDLPDDPIEAQFAHLLREVFVAGLNSSEEGYELGHAVIVVEAHRRGIPVDDWVEPPDHAS